MISPIPIGYVLPELPASANPIMVGTNHCIAGLGGDAAIEDVSDVYFSADCAEAETFFNLSQIRGAWKTYYGVSFNKNTKEVLRTKTYTYDDERGAGNWEKILEIALTYENES
jgi:hypothetical protein